jgi:hypothetical protein
MLLYVFDTITLPLATLVACVARQGRAKSHEQFFENPTVRNGRHPWTVRRRYHDTT